MHCGIPNAYNIVTIRNHIWYLIIILANIIIKYSFLVTINMEYKLLKIYSVCMSGCRLSSAIREARIAFGNDLTSMVDRGGWGWGESVMRPRGALCGCCENTLLWDVETVFIWLLE